MMFRTWFLGLQLGLSLWACAQRPTATLVSSGLIRLDLDGIRVFADAPDQRDMADIGQEDVLLLASEPAEPPPGGRTFMPSIEGEVLDRRTERLGEKTSIYVNARSIPIDGTPHNAYLVQWNGRRIYFSGATTDPADLLSLKEIDLVFISPALAAAVQQAGRAIEARTVVIYRSTSAELRSESISVPCERCRVVLPVPGEVIQLFR